MDNTTSAVATESGIGLWRNEVTIIDPTTGAIHREGHTFNSTMSPLFTLQNAIGVISADGAALRLVPTGMGNSASRITLEPMPALPPWTATVAVGRGQRTLTCYLLRKTPETMFTTPAQASPRRVPPPPSIKPWAAQPPTAASLGPMSDPQIAGAIS